MTLSGEAQQEMIGERIANEEVPEKLRQQFESMDAVQYKRFEEEARDAKKNQFKPMQFKSKNAGGSLVMLS